jgi:hypothetical protein
MWLYVLSSVSGFLIADVVIIVLLYRALVLLERIAAAIERMDARDRDRTGLNPHQV